MNKLFRFVSVLVVLAMVLGFFAAPISGGNQVSAQKEVPTFVVAPTDIPVEEPAVEPTDPPAGEPTEQGLVDPWLEITPLPTDTPEVVPLIEAAAEVAVPGRYIIVFKDGVDIDTVRASVLEIISSGSGRVAFEYSSALNGITAEISPDILRKVRQDGRIKYIEQDQKVHVDDEETPFTTQSLDDAPLSWGLDRLDQVTLPLDNNFYYPSSAGVGVNIYIIDSGIRNTHENFNGRVSLDFDAIGGSTPYAYDMYGHGTHVAGIAAGLFTGVARRANLHSVRVLDSFGEGTTSQVIAGIDWVAMNHIKPAVANMSIGGGGSLTEDMAINKAIAKGVTFVVSAGNSGENPTYADACRYSPARVPGAITVGATDSVDTRASFSNYGNCVDIFAPGVKIYSSTNQSDTSYADMKDTEQSWSGTSMSTAHVTGVVALYLAANPTATSIEATKYILDNALTSSVQDPMGSPNRLLHIPTNISLGPALVYPIKNQIIADSSPDFTWKLLTNADRYNFQISTNSSFTPVLDSREIIDSHFEYDTTLADGIYYWQVQGITTDGSHSVWSSSQVFKIDKTGPVAPGYGSPIDGAEVEGNPIFKWQSVLDAVSYNFAYDRDGDTTNGFEFVSPELKKTQFSPMFTLPNENIFWFVQAKDKLGNWGSWSKSRVVWVHPRIPSAPKLISPSYYFSTKNQSPEFTWSEVLYGIGYQLQLANNPMFNTIFYDSGPVLTDLALTLPISLPVGIYYWRVRAWNADGELSPWSIRRIIYIDQTPPAAPKPVAPVTQAVVLGTPIFKWRVPSSAKSFVFEYSATKEFSSPITSSLLSHSYYKPTPVIPEGVWYWHVCAFDEAGNQGAWSSTQVVSVEPTKPTQPKLKTPDTGFFSDKPSIEFEWFGANYAHHYEIQVDDNYHFSSVNISSSSNPGDLFIDIGTIGNLTPGIYYWRVRGVNSDSIPGPWSASKYFTKFFVYNVEFSSKDDFKDWTTYFYSPTGSWKVDPEAGYARITGKKGYWGEPRISYNATLKDISVETRMKMDPGTDGAEGGYYGLVIRGEPPSPYYRNKIQGYYFVINQYDMDEFGCFMVIRLGNGPISQFCDPAILLHDWNTLKVSANGQDFRFYINDVLMWAGSDNTFATGAVGLVESGYPFEGIPGTTYADYVRIGAPMMESSTLTSFTSSVINSRVGPFELRDSE